MEKFEKFLRKFNCFPIQIFSPELFYDFVGPWGFHELFGSPAHMCGAERQRQLLRFHVCLANNLSGRNFLLEFDFSGFFCVSGSHVDKGYHVGNKSRATLSFPKKTNMNSKLIKKENMSLGRRNVLPRPLRHSFSSDDEDICLLLNHSNHHCRHMFWRRVCLHDSAEKRIIERLTRAERQTDWQTNYVLSVTSPQRESNCQQISSALASTASPPVDKGFHDFFSDVNFHLLLRGWKIHRSTTTLKKNLPLAHLRVYFPASQNAEREIDDDKRYGHGNIRNIFMTNCVTRKISEQEMATMRKGDSSALSQDGSGSCLLVWTFRFEDNNSSAYQLPRRLLMIEWRCCTV